MGALGLHVLWGGKPHATSRIAKHGAWGSLVHVAVALGTECPWGSKASGLESSSAGKAVEALGSTCAKV
jgi:hypothetical protein